MRNRTGARKYLKTALIVLFWPAAWEAAVAEAMRILEQAERGVLADDEMKARFQGL